METRSRTSRVLTLGTMIAAVLFLTGCGYWPAAGNNGLLYTNVTTPVAVVQSEATAVRKGEACAIGLLGLFASGNSSIEAAKNSVGINNITTVEERYRQYLLGAYSQYCVIVSGT
jgi:TRL-like protein family